MKYDAWLVDLDGTLYRPLPVKLAMGVELVAFGWRELPAIRAFRRQHELLRATLEGEVPSPFSLQLARAAVDVGCSEEALRQTVNEWMVRRPGRWIRRFCRRALLAEIAAFREKGGQTALVSDYPARAKLEALDATDLFDVIVANGEHGGPTRLKPWADGYLSAARQLGVKPERCLVLGDRDDADGEAARRGGMAFRRIR